VTEIVAMQSASLSYSASVKIVWKDGLPVVLLICGL